MHHLPQYLFSDETLMDGFLGSSPREFGEIASLGTVESGRKQLILEKPKGYQNLNYVEGDYSLETKLRAMDDSGVDIAILRVPVWQEWLRGETCKIVNNEAADMCKRSSGRLYSTACVPPRGGKENLYELERCLKELGMVGVQPACHYGQLYLDDEAFKPYPKVLNELNVPVVVHHTPLPVYYQPIIDWTNLRRGYGRIMDQATAVGRELFSGMKEAMLRLDMTEGERITSYPQNNIFFDMTHPASWGKDQVECAIKVCGADHILFGTTFPVLYNWMSEGVEFMKTLDITDKERALITSKNAIRLFNLKVDRMHQTPTIRALRADEWPLYRDLRLQALAESPDAFGRTLAEEEKHPEAFWSERLASRVDSLAELPVVAQVGEEPVGLAWGRIEPADPDAAAVHQLWVAPGYRRSGAGRMLLEAIITWAKARNACYLDLDVTSGDSPARRLYERAGFRPLGELQPLRTGSELLEQPMRLVLRGDGSHLTEKERP